MTSADEQDIAARVLEVLGTVAPEADLDGLEPAKSFRDQFEFDSIDFLDFAAALEKALDVTIPEVDYPKLTSLEGCVRYLVQR